MAPPTTTATGTPPLGERLQKLATTLQFAWFVGHFTLLLCVFRYLLSLITFNSASKWAAFSYRTAFIAALATYGIVVFKAYRARVKPGAKPAETAVMLLGDENVQYLLISLVWLFSRQIGLALLPFSVYSIFHVATYTRQNLIPTFQPPKAQPATTSGGAQARPNQSGLAAAIGKFVKDYYDTSMELVATLEIALWPRLFFSALTFSRGSWILLGLYTIFLRARLHQSAFIQRMLQNLGARIDSQVNMQGRPPALQQVWGTVKNLLHQFVEATDVSKYLKPQGQVPKKAQ